MQNRDEGKSRPASHAADHCGRFYEALFASAFDAIFIMQDDRFVDCNQSAQTLFGCDRSQLIGARPFSFSPPRQPDGSDSRQAALDRIKAALAGTPQRFEWTHRRSDGEVFDAEVSLNAVSVAEERYLQAIVRDISAQKQMARQLRRNEQFMETVFDSIRDGILVLDGKLRILRANQTMQRWYSHLATLAGQPCYRLFHDRREPCENCPSRRALQSGQPASAEIQSRQANGSPLTLELFAFPMVTAAGEVDAIVEVVRDISARRRAEDLLLERQQLFSTLFENNTSVMLLVDPAQGQIVDANRAACRYYGYDKQTLRSMKITEINTLTEAEVFAEMERAKAAQRNHFHFRHRLASGEIREVEVFSGPIRTGDRVHLCSVVHDISARKAAEKEREGLIADLRQALSEVKTLRGYLPICATCKRIRDDQGYWKQIEAYIRDHSEAEFSHGICPDCIKELYPDFQQKP